MTLEILSENTINLFQLKEELARIKKRDKELNFRAAKTEEHLLHIPGYKNIELLFEKIKNLKIPRLRDQHMHKIVDIGPTTVRDLKVVMQGYTISLNNDNLKKIVDVVKGFVKK